MHGIGNDYIYVNAVREQISNPNILAKQLSDRHFGVGSDGLILILPSDVADFRMRMFNYDGSEAEMCGNASRCVGKYVYDKGLTSKRVIRLETNAGIKKLNLTIEKGKVSVVRVDMGEPILEPSLIPVITEARNAVFLPLNIDDIKYEVTCVSMGNPHAVIFTRDIDMLELSEIGPKFEYHPIFPNRINTEFVEVIDPGHVRMRVWERGAGETLACGTGACAVLVAGVLCGLLNSKARVDLRGGSLEIEWNRFDNRVYMTGGATFVYEGEIGYGIG